MSRVVFDISMSLDGFTTAANRSAEEPMGIGGQRLHEWASGNDEENRRYLASAISGLGAVITGRETYDTSMPWWGPNGPSGDARRPVFVVTHKAPDESPADGVYEFVTSGIHAALERAQKVAGDQQVCVMGGANLGQQYVAAGLVDEISLHIVPVMFSAGTLLFERLADNHIHLETLDVINTADAIHARYKVLK